MLRLAQALDRDDHLESDPILEPPAAASSAREKRVGLVQRRLGDMTAEQLVAATKAGYGTRTPAAEQQKDVTILDIFRNAAVVKIVARDWVDYLQIAKWENDWRIVNVLWELKEGR